MDMAILDGYGVDMGWIWGGYGVDMGWIWGGYGHMEWIWPFGMDMAIWDGYGHLGWIWPSGMDMAIWDGYGMDIAIWDGYGHLGWIWDGYGLDMGAWCLCLGGSAWSVYWIGLLLRPRRGAPGGTDQSDPPEAASVDPFIPARWGFMVKIY